jgi:hypothetical protein
MCTSLETLTDSKGYIIYHPDPLHFHGLPALWCLPVRGPRLL